MHEHAAVDTVHEATSEANEGEWPLVCLEGTGDGTDHDVRGGVGVRGPFLGTNPGRRLVSMRTSGTERQLWCQWEESTVVRSPSLAGRQETMRQMRSSGRVMM